MNVNHPTYLWKSKVLEQSTLGVGLDNIKGKRHGPWEMEYFSPIWEDTVWGLCIVQSWGPIPGCTQKNVWCTSMFYPRSVGSSINEIPMSEVSSVAACLMVSRDPKSFYQLSISNDWWNKDKTVFSPFGGLCRELQEFFLNKLKFNNMYISFLHGRYPGKLSNSPRFLYDPRGIRCCSDSL